jgi:hypothetical protein
VTLFASANEVVYPGSITLSGQVISNDESCEDAGEFIRIQRRVLGQSSYSNFTSGNTVEDGRFEFEVPVEMSADYVAVAPRHDNCADATSSTETVLVKVKVTARAGRRTVDRGARVGIAGAVRPDHGGTEVVLQRRKGGRFVNVAREDLNGRSRYRFVVRAGWGGRRVFRVVWQAQDDEHESNQSSNVVIRVRRGS